MRGEGEATRKIRKLVKIAEVRALRQTAGSDRCGNTKKKTWDTLRSACLPVVLCSLSSRTWRIQVRVCTESSQLWTTLNAPLQQGLRAGLSHGLRYTCLSTPLNRGTKSTGKACKMQARTFLLWLQIGHKNVKPEHRRWPHQPRKKCPSQQSFCTLLYFRSREIWTRFQTVNASKSTKLINANRPSQSFEKAELNADTVL